MNGANLLDGVHGHQFIKEQNDHIIICILKNEVLLDPHQPHFDQKKARRLAAAKLNLFKLVCQMSTIHACHLLLTLRN